MKSVVFTVVVSMMVLPMLACSGSESSFSDDQLDEQVATPGKGDYFSIPFATFRPNTSSPKVGDIMLLAYPASGLTHRELATSCKAGVCKTHGDDPVSVWSTAGATNYVRFMDVDGNLIDRYAFEFNDSGNTLRLRKVNTQHWQELTMSADVWCQEENADRQDCTDQSDVKACVGTWTCEDSLCKRHCDYDACGDSGGQCLAQGECGDGTVGDALAFPCKSEKQCCFHGLPKPLFDPLDPDQLSLAFATAAAEAKKTMPKASLTFRSVDGNPVKAGESYATTEFKWTYGFVARDQDYSTAAINVTYPGWSAKKISGMPMGSTVSQDNFKAKIKLTFSELVDQLALAKITMQTCQVAPDTKNPSFVSLKGVLGNGGSLWFWEFFCADQTILRLEANTGEKLN